MVSFFACVLAAVFVDPGLATGPSIGALALVAVFGVAISWSVLLLRVRPVAAAGVSMAAGTGMWAALLLYVA